MHVQLVLVPLEDIDGPEVGNVIYVEDQMRENLN